MINESLPHPHSQFTIHRSPFPSLADEHGNAAGRILYDGYGGVLSSTVPVTLTASVGGGMPDADTGLVYLGSGRFYDPSTGRPLQPNPVSGPPVVPQALNRYAATSAGQVGMAEGVENKIGLDSSTVWLGLATNLSLAYAGARTFVQQGRLALRGSPAALEKALAGKGLPFDIVDEFTIGGRLGEFAIGASGRLNARWQRKLLNRLLVFEVATQGEVGVIEKLGSSRFRFNTFATEVDTSGLRVTRYQRGLLLGEAKGLSLLLGAGATGVIDAGFELYGFTTGTGRWGNPYWTTTQKGIQALLVVGSDVVLAVGLAFVNPYIAIPVALICAIGSEPIIFENVAPGLYKENRNLKPIQTDGG